MSNGLKKRGKFYHIEKSIHGVWVRETTKQVSLKMAEMVLEARSREIFDEVVLNIKRPLQKTWDDAVVHYINKAKKKRDVSTDQRHLLILSRHIKDDTPLNLIFDSTFNKFRTICHRKGMKSGGINRTLEVARAILNHCFKLEEKGKPWLERRPIVNMEEKGDEKVSHVLSYEEEVLLMKELPLHLKEPTTFQLHTLARPGEVCNLEWSWYHQLPDIGGVFIIPGSKHKNGQHKAVVLNSVAQAVVERQKGKHPTHVFTYNRQPLGDIAGGAFQKAVVRAGLKNVTPHCMRHTGNTRLEHLGVELQIRKRIMGHSFGDITSDTYSRTTLEPIKKALDHLVQPTRMTLISAVNG
jgi:integrase